jgi:hypothetical protein
MTNAGFIAVSGGVFVIVLVSVASVLLSRRKIARAEAAAHVHEPGSLVEVLRTAEALEQAARRAAEYERTMAGEAAERAERYEAIASGATGGHVITKLERSAVGTDDVERRSA